MTEKEIAALISPRELDVASLVAKGFTNKEVGNLLGIIDHTVRNYMHHVYRKTGVESRYELRRLLTDPLPFKVKILE